MILIALDAKTGTISRYVAQGKSLKRTHRGSVDKEYTFDEAEVELMRLSPPSEFAHEVTLRG